MIALAWGVALIVGGAAGVVTSGPSLVVWVSLFMRLLGCPRFLFSALVVRLWVLGLSGTTCSVWVLVSANVGFPTLRTAFRRVRDVLFALFSSLFVALPFGHGLSIIA